MIIKLKQPLTYSQIREVEKLNDELFPSVHAWFVISDESVLGVNCSSKEIKKIKKIIER